MRPPRHPKGSVIRTSPSKYSSSFSEIEKKFDKEQARLRKDAKYRQLELKLLSIGGARVALHYDEDLTKELKAGQIFSLPVKRACGEMSACHTNSASLWKTNPKRYKIVVGWGLGSPDETTDQIWRQHTFVLDTKDNKLLETTVLRTKYFGAILTDKQAEKFYEGNE